VTDVNPVADGVGDITPEWLSHALDREVGAVRAERIGTGQTGATYRLDNLLFAPEGDEVLAIDWQTLAVGPAGRDIGYFLGTCLRADDRRAVENDLVATYHAALLARGVEGYDLARCIDDYRRGQLQGPFVTTVGCVYATGERSGSSDAMFLAMARRSCAAIRDLDSLELVT
jgi:hypothetical protein